METEGPARAPAGRPRLQKALARAGVASRRHAEDLIRAGRVRVNGQTVSELGTRVDPEVDEILLDGRAITRRAGATYVALHKPRGYLTTAHDPEGRPTVMSLAPPVPGLFPVGRLDAESEGLLLLTTDGEWAQRVSHPRFGCAKEYLVNVPGRPAGADLERLRRPLLLAPGERTSGAHVEVLDTDAGGSRLRIVVREGRNRQIRRMLEQVGYPVRRLVRVRVGGVELGSLAPGAWRHLTPREVAEVANLTPSPFPRGKGSVLPTGRPQRATGERSAPSARSARLVRLARRRAGTAQAARPAQPGQRASPACRG